MTARRPLPTRARPAGGVAIQFKPLRASVAQRRGFRDYLQGLLAPRDRNKTLTGLADAEPITGASIVGPAAAMVPVGIGLGPRGGALHAGVAATRWSAGSGVPDQAAAGGRAGPGAREAGIEFRAVVADCSMATIPASPTRL
jgi:hypothetical protein